VAVLPFEDQTDTEGLAGLVRESFYSHLSVRPFRDVELEEVDRRLRDREISLQGGLSPQTARLLGEILDCDAVIWGEVTRFRRIFAGIYSQMAVGARVEIWDTRSGRRVWTDDHVVRYHEGGIPLNPLDIPLLSLRSGGNLRPVVKVRAVDELARYLARRVPAPQGEGEALDPTQGYLYEIQAGAFLEEDRASRLAERLRQRGLPAFIRRHRDGRGLWHRVILGPYEDRREAFQVQKKAGEITGAGCFISRVLSKAQPRVAPRR
jgi:hypothetical protein